MEKKGKILIVDDEQINLEFFDVMLSKLGFEVETADDGEMALDKVRETEPDLIILENLMPKMSGWDVTRALKTDEEYADYRHIPIIMFSAMHDVKDKIEGFELGIEDYITKPFNFSEVLARIRAVLRSRELSQQVVQRERRIALIETLNKSLVYFTSHLRSPVEGVLQAAAELDPNDVPAVKTFVEQVKQESETILAALGGLEGEIQDLLGKGDELKAQELTLELLEDKYQKHFEQYRQSRS